MLILNLCHQRFSLDHPVQDYLKSSSLKSGYGLVTLRHFLSHQGGIEDPEDSFGVHPGRPDMAHILTERRCMQHTHQSSQAAKPDVHLFRCRLLHRPTGGGRRTGYPFESAIDEHLFRPLGMNRSMYEPASPMTSGHEPDGSILKHGVPHYPYAAASGRWSMPSDLMNLVKELFRSFKRRGDLIFQRVCDGNDFSARRRNLGGPRRVPGWRRKLTEISSLGWGEGFQSMMVAEPLKGKAWVIIQRQYRHPSDEGADWRCVSSSHNIAHGKGGKASEKGILYRHRTPRRVPGKGSTVSEQVDGIRRGRASYHPESSRGTIA